MSPSGDTDTLLVVHVTERLVGGLRRAKGRDLERWLLSIEPSRDPSLVFPRIWG